MEVTKVCSARVLVLSPSRADGGLGCNVALPVGRMAEHSRAEKNGEQRRTAAGGGRMNVSDDVCGDLGKVGTWIQNILRI